MSTYEQQSRPTEAGERQQVVAAILVSRGDVLAARRTHPAELAGRWEFPGGKVEPDESLRDALVRELREELGVVVQVDAEFESRRGPWPIDDQRELRVFFATVLNGDPRPGNSHDELVWLPVPELDTLEWLDADRPVAEALAARPMAQPGHNS